MYETIQNQQQGHQGDVTDFGEVLVSLLLALNVIQLLLMRFRF